MRRFSFRKVVLHKGDGRRPGKRGYWVRWTDDHGKNRFRCFDTKRLAEQGRRAIEYHVNRWFFIDSDDTPWQAALEAYQETIADRTHGHKRRIAGVLRNFDEYARPETIRDFTTDTIQVYLNSRIEQVAPHTRATEYRYLHAFGAFLEKRGLVGRNPVFGVTRPKVPRRMPRVPSIDDWLRLLNTIPETALDDRQGWHLLLVLAVVTGVRQTPLRTLTRDRFEPPSDTTDGVSFVTCISKGDVESVHGLPVPVTERMVTRLACIPKHQTKVFIWKRWPRTAWDRLCEHAGFPFPFHGLRACAGTLRAYQTALASGAAALNHSAPRVFASHYADAKRIQLGVAKSLELPELPPMPPYKIVAVPRSPRPTAGTEVRDQSRDAVDPPTADNTLPSDQHADTDTAP